MRRAFFATLLVAAWACIPLAIPASLVVIAYRRWRAAKDGGNVIVVDFTKREKA